MCKRKPKITVDVKLDIDELFYLQRSLIHFREMRWDLITDMRIEKLIKKVDENTKILMDN